MLKQLLLKKNIPRIYTHLLYNFSADKSEGDINLSPFRTEYLKNHSSKKQSLLKRDSDCFLHQTLSTPCLNVLKSCKNSKIYDIDDEQDFGIFDFHGNSVHQVGFRNEFIISKITQQINELSFCPRRYTNLPAIELAEKLTSLAPGDLNRVLFCPGGTSAVGIAMKLARVATGRHKVISMWDSFHGASLDCISIGGEAVFRKNIGPLLPGVEHVPPCDEMRCVFKCKERGGCDLACAEYIEYILEKEQDVSAVIAEPIRWTPYIPKAEYWQKVRKACDKHKTLLIFDEIPNSLGRTGKGMFTFEMFGIIPDIVAIGKGLGGGILPLAAIIARENLNEHAKNISLGHYTHEKNPVLCAAGLATLEYIEKHDLINKTAEKGEITINKLKNLMKKYPIIGDVRGQGLLIGIELVKDRKTMERATEEAEFIMYACMKRGLSFKLTMGNIITWCPPLIITQDELDKAIEILENAILDLKNYYKN